VLRGGAGEALGCGVANFAGLVRQTGVREGLGEFRALLRMNPDYSAAYYHGGQTLEQLGQIDEARSLYQQGIEATTRTGDLHTRGEIQAALDILG
jgi:hypothetical protein